MRRVSKVVWVIQGFDKSDDLAVEHELSDPDGATHLSVLQITHIREYLGGGHELSEEDRVLLSTRYGIGFQKDFQYFLEYFRDFPGQVIKY